MVCLWHFIQFQSDSLRWWHGSSHRTCLTRLVWYSHHIGCVRLYLYDFVFVSHWNQSKCNTPRRWQGSSHKSCLILFVWYSHHIDCVRLYLYDMVSLSLLFNLRWSPKRDDRAHGIDHVWQCLCDILIIQIVSDSICMILCVSLLVIGKPLASHLCCRIKICCHSLGL